MRSRARVKDIMALLPPDEQAAGGKISNRFFEEMTPELPKGLSIVSQLWGARKRVCHKQKPKGK